MTLDTRSDYFDRPADAYDRFVGRYGPALARATLERVRLEPGRRVLDVGCGPGALTIELARVIGPGAVTAIDPSESFAAACAERVPGAEVRIASAASLPFEDGTFDAAFSQLVVNFIPDPEAGLREMRRVTRPGGLVASTVWDYTGGMTMLRRFWDAAVEVDPVAAGPRDEGFRLSHSSPEGLTRLWEETGLEEVSTEPVDVGAAYRDFDDLWVPFLAGIGPAGSYTVSLREPAREELREAYRQRLGSPEGPFELTARAWLVRGTVPA